MARDLIVLALDVDETEVAQILVTEKDWPWPRTTLKPRTLGSIRLKLCRVPAATKDNHATLRSPVTAAVINA